LSGNRIKIQSISQFETVARGSNLLFHRKFGSGRYLFLNFDLFAESARKIDIRHFIKEKAFLIAEVQKTIGTKYFRSELCSTSTYLMRESQT